MSRAENIFLFSYRGNHGVRRHECITILNIRIKDIESGRMFGEDHGRAVKSVGTQLGSSVFVHGDSAETTHVSQGQDIGDGVLVVPDRAKIGEVADHG